jgi:hypothetical protein
MKNASGFNAEPSIGTCEGNAQNKTKKQKSKLNLYNFEKEFNSSKFAKFM